MVHAKLRKKTVTELLLYQKSSFKFISGIVFFLCLIASLVLTSVKIYYWMGDEKSQPIAEIVILGERKYTTDEDIREALLSSGRLSTVMNQDIHFLRNQIEKLTWLDRVTLKKRWPNKLIIDLKEKRPVVRWNKNFLMDANGSVFTIPFERTVKEPLVFLFGPEGLEKESLKGFNELQNIFKKNQIILISSTMSDRYSWLVTVLLNSNSAQRIIEIELGRTDYVNRAQKFMAIYRELEKKPEISQLIKKIDMRYETGAAISWHISQEVNAQE
ncbi:FtsQ-type POTRA domain-containing protein [Thorsellia kenyensis]|uniref:FtsQ-type POTRA domain-containing protein n=1 Tax=Thorsellia kenyensis TaxID=1549888 RepID=A0ABV6CBM9_9GAMM